MSLDVAVAVPFRQQGKTRLEEGAFVVALSLDRDWFSPDQAKRLIDVATGRGLIAREDGKLVAQFDPTEVQVPEDFTPDASIIREQSTFEMVLDALVAAGHEKQEVVATANEHQREHGVTLETAAILYARRHDVDVGDAVQKARDELAQA